MESKSAPSPAIPCQGGLRVELPGGAVASLSDSRQVALMVELIQALQSKGAKD